MSEAKSLWGLEIFQGLTDEELTVIASIMTEVEVDVGEFICRQDQHGDTLYVILEGEVEVTLRIAEGVEETLATIREGSYFGEMALVDPGDRSASVHAVTPCRLLVLVRRDFFELAASDNALGLKVFLNLALTLTERLRTTTESQRKAVLWGHQISGAAHLNFYRMIADNRQVTVHLATGKHIEGVMLKVDETRSGHEITFKSNSDVIHIVPYHAISQIVIQPDSSAILEAPTVSVAASSK